MKGQKDSSDVQALKIANGERGSGRGRGRNSARGHGRGRQSKESIECYKCHKLGHYQNECPTWGENANYAAEFDYEEETLLMVATNSEDLKKQSWFLDSGCSNHMVGNKDWLYELDESY
jgi:ribosomal protein L15